MTEAQAPSRSVIEPFDPDRHDRASFSCDLPQVDNLFKRTASKLAKADKLRVYVMLGFGRELIGFYALNAHAVDFADLPAKYVRTGAGHGSIPAAYISMIGVDERFQGRGIGGDLLIDGLHRIAFAADAIGIAVVMLDVLDCGDPDRVTQRASLYEGYGFIPLAANPLRMILPIATVRSLLA